MADDESRNEGLLGAHSQAENPAEIPEPNADRAAKVGSTRAMTEEIMADLAGQIGGVDDPEQQSLMLDEADEQMALFRGPVRHVANQIETARNGRGRPKGAKNKANAEFRDMLLRMGYRHPGLNLAALANADPLILALELMGYDLTHDVSSTEKVTELIISELEAGRLTRAALAQHQETAKGMLIKANAELLPYFESKAPAKLQVDRNVRGVMMIGEFRVETAQQSETLDLTSVPAPEEKDQ